MPISIDIRRERDEKIIRLRSEGLTYQQIGDQVGLSRQGVLLVLQKYAFDGKIKVEKTCEMCGTVFWGNPGKQRLFCSDACAEASRDPQNALKRIYDKEQRLLRNTEMQQKWEKGGYTIHQLAHEYGVAQITAFRTIHGYKSKKTEKACEHCGKIFVARGEERKYCSKDCWNSRRSADIAAQNKKIRTDHMTRKYTIAELAKRYSLSYSTVQHVVHDLIKPGARTGAMRPDLIGAWRHAKCFHCSNEYLKDHRKQIYCSIDCKVVAQAEYREKRNGLLPRSW